jgi:steroid delta-isomerase-like uncharacterized protein
MTREEIVALFDRRHAAWDRRDAAALAALHAGSCVVESPTAGGRVTGREAIAKVYETWFTAFPDATFAHEELLIDADRAAQVAILSGTDTGGFMGLPPTGKPFRVPLLALCTLKDHEIVYERRIYDFTGMLIQIGVLKAKPA